MFAITLANVAHIGSFAPHEKNGESMIASRLSLSLSSALVAIIPGTAQPKHIRSGMNALPESPNLLHARSSMNATRAMYPVSSMIDKNKYNSITCGMKLKTESSPLNNPSHKNPETQVPSYPARASPAAVASIRLPVPQPSKLCSHTPKLGTPDSPASIKRHLAKSSLSTVTPYHELRKSISSLNVI